MDAQLFDRVTKVLGRATNRRTGIIAAVVGLVTASGATLDVDAARKATRRHEKLACRNANSQCLTDDECCSGHCVPKFGGTEFRCAKGRSRKKDGGKKGGSGSSGEIIPTGEPCTSADTCEDPNASCTPYADDSPSGTYCLLRNGITCEVNAVCAGHLCDSCTCCTTSGEAGLMTTFGNPGSGAGAFDGITGVAISPDEEQALFTDMNNNRVSVRTRTASCSLDWQAATTFNACSTGTLLTPAGVVYTPDGLTALVGDSGNSRICIFRRTEGNTDWTPITTFGSAGTNLGELSGTRALAISPDGLTLAVSQNSASPIAVFSRPSTSSDVWTSEGFFGSNGNGDSEFSSPWGLTFSEDGLTLYIVDETNTRISVWSRSSTASFTFTNDYVWTSGIPWDQPGGFSQPSAVVVRDAGLTMLVGNWNNIYIGTFTRPNTSSTAWALESSVSCYTQKSMSMANGNIYSGDLTQVLILGPICQFA